LLYITQKFIKKLFKKNLLEEYNLYKLHIILYEK